MRRKTTMIRWWLFIASLALCGILGIVYVVNQLITEHQDTNDGIHIYEFHTGGYDWLDAQEIAYNAGGKLVTFDSVTEYEYVLQQIENAGMRDVYFCIGGCRKDDTKEYYWLDRSGNFYGSNLCDKKSICYDLWHIGEPSYEWKGQPEPYMGLHFDTLTEEWGLNDIRNHLTSPSDPSLIGFIIEYPRDVGDVILEAEIESSKPLNFDVDDDNLANNESVYPDLSEADSALESKDYISAITLYRAIPSDSKSYQFAQKSLATAESAYRDETMLKANTLIDSKKYADALEILNEGLLILKDDASLTAQFEVCKQAIDIKEQSTKKAAEYAASKNYKAAAAEIEAALKYHPNDSELNNLYKTYSSMVQAESSGSVVINYAHLPPEVDFEVPTSGYLLSDSDKRYISSSELKGMTEHQVCLTINEFYAKHGRLFEEHDVKDYFESLSWYVGTIRPSAFDENCFNDYEKQNIKTVIDYAKSKGWR